MTTPDQHDRAVTSNQTMTSTLAKMRCKTILASAIIVSPILVLTWWIMQSQMCEVSLYIEGEKPKAGDHLCLTRVVESERDQSITIWPSYGRYMGLSLFRKLFNNWVEVESTLQNPGVVANGSEFAARRVSGAKRYGFVFRRCGPYAADNQMVRVHWITPDEFEMAVRAGKLAFPAVETMETFELSKVRE